MSRNIFWIKAWPKSIRNGRWKGTGLQGVSKMSNFSAVELFYSIHAIRWKARNSMGTQRVSSIKDFRRTVSEY